MRLDNILHEIDCAIDQYLWQNETLNKDIGYENGHLKDSRKYDEYEHRKEHIFTEYDASCHNLRRKLAEAVRVYRGPRNNPTYMPEAICVGTGNILYEGLNEKIPLLQRFPFSKAGFVPDIEEEILTYRMYCLLRSLPKGKCTFYIYDPAKYGRNVGPLAELWSCPEVFPSGKAYVRGELASLLKEVQGKVARINQYDLPSKGCEDWWEYNKKIEENKENSKKLLPYCVVVLFGLPQGADQNSIEEIRNLINVGPASGVYFMFSTNSQENDENHPSNTVAKSIEILKEKSENLDTLSILQQGDLRHLKLKQDNSLFERVLQGKKIRDYVSNYKKELETWRKYVVSLKEMLQDSNLFSGSAVNGVDIPLGTKENGELGTLHIGNEPVHVLIGGATGSGKSNLIHDIILNACWKYSPVELQFYLLDYKEGVEFNKYAMDGCILPQAALVANYADVGYGLTVLDHLTQIYRNRVDKFKKVGKTNYADFRKAYPDEYMPRIILIIDEFQRLYLETANSDKLKALMMNLSKLGRNAGIHMLFATQSLKSLSDFNEIKSQFIGRLVCKCSIEDSNSFLSYNNAAAAEIKIPQVVFNTQNGIPDYNEILSVPEVKDSYFAKIIRKLKSACSSRGIKVAEGKVFDGEKQPSFPGNGFAVNDKFYLGTQTDYDENKFTFSLEKGNTENVLVLGKNTTSLLKNFMQSALEIKKIDHVIYIGDPNALPGISFTDKFCNFDSFQDFSLMYPKEKPSDGAQDQPSLKDLEEERYLIIVNRESFPTFSRTQRTEGQDWKSWLDAFVNTLQKDNHLIVFYDSASSWQKIWREVGDGRNMFHHVIGYNIPPQDWNTLSQISDNVTRALVKQKRSEKRAIYAYEDQLIMFKPFKDSDGSE